MEGREEGRRGGEEGRGGGEGGGVSVPSTITVLYIGTSTL